MSLCKMSSNSAKHITFLFVFCHHDTAIVPLNQTGPLFHMGQFFFSSGSSISELITLVA